MSSKVFTTEFKMYADLSKFIISVSKEKDPSLRPLLLKISHFRDLLKCLQNLHTHTQIHTGILHISAQN